jgi:hypothetical protein
MLLFNGPLEGTTVIMAASIPAREAMRPSTLRRLDMLMLEHTEILTVSY